MCGIAGIVSSDRRIDRRAFSSMCDALAHRGPDADGQVFLRDDTVALGHRRLSIIDLSVDANQPMSNEDSQVWITFNGEVYNYMDLRRLLLDGGHVFKSMSDTETVMHAYEAWGVECVHRLRGIFAFAIWDAKKGELFLARDHIGVKPLYYSWTGAEFVFASELKAMVRYPNMSCRVCREALRDYLAYGYVPGTRSIYERVHKLQAGHMLQLSTGAPQVHQYWDLVYSGCTAGDDAASIIEPALDDAVRAQLVSDVPVGVFLSGGIDSSAVAYYASKHACGHPATFTVGFDVAEFDERRHAREAARAFSTNHHEKMLSYDTAKNLLPTFVEVFDEPFFDCSGIPTYLLSQFARQEVKVALSGDGGDEVFAGYMRYDQILKRVAQRSPSLGRRLAASMGLAVLLPLARQSWTLQKLHRLCLRTMNDPVDEYVHQFPFLETEELTQLLSPEVTRDVSEPVDWLFRKYWRSDWPRISALQYLDIKTYLAEDILVKVDRASMACSLEVRVPFLDTGLVEAVFQVDSAALYGGMRKRLLKESLRGRVPESLLSTRKKGFSVPLAEWLSGSLRETAIALITKGSMVKNGFFSCDNLAGILGKATPDRLWLLLELELWARRWLEQEDIHGLLWENRREMS